MSLERNCALCMDTGCDKQGTPDNFAERCHGWDEPSLPFEDKMLEGRVYELEDRLDRLELSFNRMVAAVCKAANE